MVILILIILLLSNALTLRRDKSSEKKMVVAAQAASLLIAYALKNILHIISLDSVFFTAVFIGLISSFCFIIRGICTSDKLPSKYITLLVFISSSIIGALVLAFDYTRILYVVHPCMLYLLS
jgi:hypothetical protein